MTNGAKRKQRQKTKPENRFHWLRSLSLICLQLAIVFFLTMPMSLCAAFGVTSSSGNYVVDTGSGLVFKVSQSNGDINSIVFNSTEYQATDKRSHLISGLGTATVNAVSYGASYIKITIATSDSNTVVSNLTHYLMVRNGVNTIYMATFMESQPAVGELRWITRLQSAKIGNGPVPSDIRNTTGAIESSDVFGVADGTTRSKYYGDDTTRGKKRAMDLTYTGATGTGIGVWMVFGNRESSSGGPFFRDIQNQCGTDQEIYNYMNSGHNQTETHRLGILHGPYALVFTTGAAPTLPLDFSWIESGGLNLLGWVSPTNRGAVKGVAWGVPAGFQGVVGFANSTAQYWATVSSNGTYATPLMKEGTYTAKLYKEELEVATNSVTIVAGQTNVLNLGSTETAPDYIFKIGEWSGTPKGFLNASNITVMHPSDVRNDADWAPWPFDVTTNLSANFPAIQFRATNSPARILFNLTANQIKTLTLRIGLTCAYNNGRPKPSIGSWTPSNPSASSQPSSRSFTVGTYRGNNSLFSFSVPSSAFVVGQNTLSIDPISGNSDLGTWLSAGWVYDCIELAIPNTAPAPAASPTTLTAVFASSSKINLLWKDNSTNEVNFMIERSSDGTNFTLIGAVTAGITNFIDNSILAGGNYYHVRASNPGGQSAYSNVATARAPTLASPLLSGNQIVFSGSGGAAGNLFYFVTTTNLSLPAAQWTRAATNQFDALGKYSVTNIVHPGVQQQFYRIQLP